MKTFNVKKATNDIIEYLKDWFDTNGHGCNAIIGMSGGKDSTIAAKILVEALGKDVYNKYLNYSTSLICYQ